MEKIISEADEQGFVDFGEVCRELLDLQCQYGSYYLKGLAGYPDLSSSVRTRGGEDGNYHAIEIHRDDVAKFVELVKTARGF